LLESITSMLIRYPSSLDIILTKVCSVNRPQMPFPPQRGRDGAGVDLLKETDSC